MGLGVRTAAAACLMASGLFVGGASGALASADPALDSPGPDQDDGTTTEPAQKDETNSPPDVNIGEQNSAKGEIEQEKPDSQKPADQKPDDGRHVDQKPVDEKHVDADTLPIDPDEDPGQGDVGEGEATLTDESEPAEAAVVLPPKEEPVPSRCEKQSDDDCETRGRGGVAGLAGRRASRPWKTDDLPIASAVPACPASRVPPERRRTRCHRCRPGVE